MKIVVTTPTGNVGARVAGRPPRRRPRDVPVEAILGMSIGLREDFVPEDERSILTTTPTTLAARAHEHLAR
jgi:hypothetical protein